MRQRSGRVGDVVDRVLTKHAHAVDVGGSVEILVTATRTADQRFDVTVQTKVNLRPPAEASRLPAAGPVGSEGSAGLDGPAAHLLDSALPRSPFVDRVVATILDRLHDEHLDVPRLARSLHMSPSQLGRRLRATTGQSPARLIRLVRLSRAYALVGESDATLASIAHACGFSDHAHLCRTFRRYLGTTPSAVRRTLRAVARA